jgi:hypothetical protein
MLLIELGQVSLPFALPYVGQMGVPITHSQVFVPDHFFHILDARSWNDQIGAESVTKIVEVKFRKPRPFPCRPIYRVFYTSDELSPFFHLFPGPFRKQKAPDASSLFLSSNFSRN